MVVEDESEIRLVLRTYLEDEGYRVVEAETGEQALSLSLDETPDVVLVDLGGDDDDGDRTCGPKRPHDVEAVDAG